MKAGKWILIGLGITTGVAALLGVVERRTKTAAAPQPIEPPAPTPTPRAKPRAANVGAAHAARQAATDQARAASGAEDDDQSMWERAGSFFDGDE